MEEDVALLTTRIHVGGGTEKVIRQQADALDGDIFCTYVDPEVKKEFFYGFNIRLYESPLAGMITRLFSLSPRDFIGQYLTFMFFSPEVLENHDVVIAHDPLAFLLAFKAKRRNSCLEVIWYCHHPDHHLHDIEGPHKSSFFAIDSGEEPYEYEPFRSPAYYLRQLWKNPERVTSFFYWRFIYPALIYPRHWMKDSLKEFDRRAFMGVDKVFVNSRNTRDNQLKRCYGDAWDKAEVLYPPVALYDRSDSAGKHVFTLSRVVPYKQLDIAIELCANLEPSPPLRIAGSIMDGEYGTRLEESAEARNVDLELLGFIPEERVEQEIRECKFGIFTSEHEDFGLVPLEFLSTGKVCFVPRSAGVAEVIPEKYQFGSLDELIDKISRLDSYLDHSLRERIESLNENHFRKLTSYIAKRGPDSAGDSCSNGGDSPSTI